MLLKMKVCPYSMKPFNCVSYINCLINTSHMINMLSYVSLKDAEIYQQKAFYPMRPAA